MTPLILPLVEKLVKAYSGPSLSRIKIIGAQHVVETTHAMFRSLYKLGLKPENISIIGKCYSTNRDVYDEMVADGIDMAQGSFSYSSHQPFDEVYAEEVKKFLTSHIQDLTPENYDRLIILDDGGKCIDFISDYINTPDFAVAIEQTSAGYEAIRHKSLPFPVINVARSPVKLKYESPMIAKAAADRLYLSLRERVLTPNKALIIGGGAIGKAMEEKLSTKMEVVVYDQNQEFSSKVPFNFPKDLAKFPLIIGCTGKVSLPSKYHPFLPKGASIVSVSSSDREFDSVYLRKKISHNNSCHRDLVIDDLLLINSGFPVNFDGERENIDPESIQLTIALIAAAVLQGRSLPKGTPTAILPVASELERMVVGSFFE